MSKIAAGVQQVRGFTFRMGNLNSRYDGFVDCYDCGDGWPKDLVERDERLSAGRRCPNSYCDSNHQLACNEQSQDILHSLCRCVGARPGMTRTEKDPVSDTGLTEAARAELERRTDFIESLMSVPESCRPTQAILRIRAMLATFEIRDVR